MIEEKDISGVASLPDLDTIRDTVKRDPSLLQVLYLAMSHSRLAPKLVFCMCSKQWC